VIKIGSDDDEVTGGRVFHTRGATTPKARSIELASIDYASFDESDDP